MKKTHWPTRLAAGCLVTLTLVGVAFAAGQQGSQSDPLVTLSYLTQKATPSILLRSGTATCVSDTSPGLVDMTAGTTLAGGGALTANHLYLATIEGRGVKASTAVTLLVRGTYSIQ